MGHAGADASVVAAIWMLATVRDPGSDVAVGFWHGRWGTLAAGAGALGGGLAQAAGPHGWPGWWRACLFGAGMGLTYYAALYYSLAVGHAAVDAGGNFEALIGLGYCVGPLLGVAAHAGAGPARAPLATVALASLVGTAVSSAAVRPYLEARRRRARQ